MLQSMLKGSTFLFRRSNPSNICIAPFDSDCDTTDDDIFMEDPKVAARDKQPTASELAQYKIKTRDFYYESDLPPIRSVIHRQVQPGPASIKHDRESTPESIDHPPKRPRTLARVPTEIVGESCSDAPSRGVLGGRSSSRLHRYPPMLSTVLPTLLLPDSQFDSQTSESDNQSMTPNGSFRFDARYQMHTSEVSPSQSDSASQMNPSRSFCHLGFTFPASQSRPPSSSPHLVRHNSSMICNASARLSVRTSSLITCVSSSHQTPAPRYYLRQRKPISYLMSTKSKRPKRQDTTFVSSNIKQSLRKPSKLR